MTRELTLQLPEKVIEEASSLATLSGFTIDELVANLFKVILTPTQTIH